jgi:hypothetical protein
MSDGSGTYDLGEADGVHRGTKIVISLKVRLLSCFLGAAPPRLLSIFPLAFSFCLFCDYLPALCLLPLLAGLSIRLPPLSLSSLLSLVTYSGL